MLCQDVSKNESCKSDDCNSCQCDDNNCKKSNCLDCDTYCNDKNKKK
jgi:hypothetical protein